MDKQITSLFGLAPLNPTDLPQDTRQLIRESNRFIESVTSSWKRGKTFTYGEFGGLVVPTYSAVIDDEFWCARVSQVDTEQHSFRSLVKHLTGAEFKEEQGEWVIRDKYRHTECEGKYIPLIAKWKPIKWNGFESGVQVQNPDGHFKEEFEHLKDWICVNLEYRLGSVLTNREFNQFILVTPPTLLRELEPESTNSDDETLVCFVVSLVANVKVFNQNNVHAAYCSIERLKHDPNTQTVQWSMATTSDARGNLPKKLQRLAMAKTISHDVPSFLQFLNTLKKDEINH